MRDDVYLSIMRKRIRQARHARKLSQDDMAERTGLPLRTYQRFEARREKRPFNPSFFNLLAVAKAMEVDLAEFVKDPTPEEVEALEEKR